MPRSSSPLWTAQCENEAADVDEGKKPVQQAERLGRRCSAARARVQRRERGAQQNSPSLSLLAGGVTGWYQLARRDSVLVQI